MARRAGERRPRQRHPERHRRQHHHGHHDDQRSAGPPPGLRTAPPSTWTAGGALVSGPGAADAAPGRRSGVVHEDEGLPPGRLDLGGRTPAPPGDRGAGPPCRRRAGARRPVGPSRAGRRGRVGRSSRRRPVWRTRGRAGGGDRAGSGAGVADDAGRLALGVLARRSAMWRSVSRVCWCSWTECRSSASRRHSTRAAIAPTRTITPTTSTVVIATIQPNISALGTAGPKSRPWVQQAGRAGTGAGCAGAGRSELRRGREGVARRRGRGGGRRARAAATAGARRSRFGRLVGFGPVVELRHDVPGEQLQRLADVLVAVAARLAHEDELVDAGRLVGPAPGPASAPACPPRRGGSRGPAPRAAPRAAGRCGRPRRGRTRSGRGCARTPPTRRCHPATCVPNT